MDKINNKIYEINRLLEEKGCPLAVEMKGFDFKEVEEIRYRLMEKGLIVNIYEEFKILHIGIKDKN